MQTRVVFHRRKPSTVVGSECVPRHTMFLLHFNVITTPDELRQVCFPIWCIPYHFHHDSCQPINFLVTFLIFKVELCSASSQTRKDHEMSAACMHHEDMDSWQRVCTRRMASGLGHGLHTRGPIWILASITYVLGRRMPLASLSEKTHLLSCFWTRSPQSEMKVLIVTAWYPLKRTFASRNCFLDTFWEVIRSELFGYGMLSDFFVKYQCAFYC